MPNTEARPSDQPRVVGVDSLRALAALGVFVCHINQYWQFLHLPGKLPQVAALGAHGVDLFVSISGFCLALSVLAEGGRLNLGQFLGRRALRILPAYYVALSIATVLATLPSTYGLIVASRAGWWDFGVHMMAAQTWVPSTLGHINGSLWSVSLEVQLYIVFPALVLLWRRYGFISVLIGTGALSLVWETIGSWHSGIHTNSVLGSEYVLPDRLVQFFAGAYCAHLVCTRTVPATRYLIGVLLVGSISATSMSTLDISIGHAVLWAIPSAAAILLVAGNAGTLLARTPLNSLGRVSYSFYLLHQPIVLLLAQPAEHIPGAWSVQLFLGGALALGTAIAAAWILFRLVEYPSHRLGKRLFHDGRCRRISRTDSVQIVSTAGGSSTGPGDFASPLTARPSVMKTAGGQTSNDGSAS